MSEEHCVFLRLPDGGFSMVERIYYPGILIPRAFSRK